jgi:GxxExxY protein
MLRVPTTLSVAQEEIVRQTIDVGFAVHRELGPGFKECTYEEAFCLELDARMVKFERQKPISVRYKQ